MKKYIHFFILLLCLASKIEAEDNQVIYLLSSPRSLSTSFLKMMHYRGDFQVLNEPFANQFYETKVGVNPNRPFGYVDIAQVPSELENFQTESSLFVKDIVSNLVDFLDRPSFSSFYQQNCDWLILARDPAEVIISLYNAFSSEEIFLKFFSDKEDLSKEVGMRGLYSFLEKLLVHSKKSPKIIFTHQIAEDPESFFKTFCSHVQIPYSHDQLFWGSEEIDYLNVPVQKDGSMPAWAQAFYYATIKSSHFKKMRSCLRNESGAPTFEEVKNPKLRSLFHEVYKENIVYYDKLLDAKEFHLIY